MMRLLAAALLLAAASAAAGESEAERNAAATIVLYNKKDESSLALAKYYAERRSIPADQVIGLSCAPEEEITRDAYLVDIEAPLRAIFTKREWWKIDRDSEGRRFVEWSKIRFAAIMRGMPMKIRSEVRVPQPDAPAELQPGTPQGLLAQHNEASVDSELAAMFTLLEEAPSAMANTYYRRFAHITTLPTSGGPLLVCRLDGPSEAIVRGMIDSAIAAERKGLWGWAYLDARNITAGSYAEGDAWITRAGESMRRKGIPVIADYAPEVLPEGYPVTDAAIYYGWYAANVAGPFANINFRFRPGAIAVHIHSYSARSIRRVNEAWAGPLVARGAAATMGNVYEPYLSLTVNFDILQDRLMTGLTLAEAAYSAMRGLSWMGVVLGDPLYRPYAMWRDWSATIDGSNPWQRYRQIVLEANGDPLAAAKELRKFATESRNSMPLEALGQAQAAAGDFAEAIRTLAEAARIEKSTNIRFRLALSEIEILRRMGRDEEALRKISDALGKFRSDSQKTALGSIALILRPPPPPEPEAPSRSRK